ncbi:MAG: fibronectin type III domain-containing protein, partial [bacterium]
MRAFARAYLVAALAPLFALALALPGVALAQDATLTALSITAGDGTALTFRPTFDPTVTRYDVAMPPTQTFYNVAMTRADTSATVSSRWNNGGTTSTTPTGFTSTNIPTVNAGDTITITVTSGSTSMSYIAVVWHANAPTLPTGASVAAGDDSIAVAWTVSEARGERLFASAFEVCHHQGATFDAAMCDDDDIQTVPGGRNALDLDLTGLIAGVTYAVAVRAVHAAFEPGAWVDAGSATPTQTEVPEPGMMTTSAPTNVMAVAGDGAITVSWSAPTEPRVPTGYDVCVYATGDNAVDLDGNCVGGPVTAISDVATTTHIASGLTNDDEYAVAVRGTHNDGDSDWATPSPETATPTAPALSSDSTISTFDLYTAATGGSALSTAYANASRTYSVALAADEPSLWLDFDTTFAAARGAFTRASTEHADTPLDKTERNQFLNFAQGMSEDITIT